MLFTSSNIINAQDWTGYLANHASTNGLLCLAIIEEADPIMQENVLFIIKPGAAKSEGARQAGSQVGRGRSEAEVVNPTERDETRERWDRKGNEGKPGQQGRQDRESRHGNRRRRCRQGRRVRQKTEKHSVSVIGMATIFRNPWSLAGLR